jgi:4-amino-4-deoxy-L-arabinose transferase-like glycosyltransferase
MLDTNKKIVYHLLGLSILVYFIVFVKLNAFHMRWWDESMFAVNTYEMMHNGHYFSLYYNGLPDLMNTKPPLTNWIQLIFVKLLGYNELAIRLPSALGAAFSILLVFKFIAKKFNLTWAWLSALILLTSYGFVHVHTARTGDSDSLLSFFLLAANFSFLTYLFDHKKQHIFLFFLFIAFAFAAKLYAALLFTPAYLIILLQQKKLKEFILSKQFLAGVLLLLFTAFGLIYLRELNTPGYLNVILFKDAGRIFKVVENHKEGIDFYLYNLFGSRFSTWFMLLITGVLFSFFLQRKSEKQTLHWLMILCSVYLLLITCSITKLEWYDMPLYPYLAIIAAYPVYLLLTADVTGKQRTSPKQQLIVIALIFAYPYYTMFGKSQANTMSNGEKTLEANERYLFKAGTESKNLNGLMVYYINYNGSLLFYKYKLGLKGQQINLVTAAAFHTNDVVLCCNDSLKKQLNMHYQYDVIDSYNEAQVVRITGEVDTAGYNPRSFIP